MAKKKDKLTPKQRKFINRYLSNNFNATEAGIYAGYSKKTATEQGARLLTNVHIQEVFNKAFENNGLMVNKALQNIARIANANITDYIEIDELTGVTKVKPLNQMNNTQVIKTIKEKRKIIENEDGSKAILDDTFEFTLHDSLKANELIVKMAGKMQPDTTIQVNTTDNDKITELINTIKENDTK